MGRGKEKGGGGRKGRDMIQIKDMLDLNILQNLDINYSYSPHHYFSGSETINFPSMNYSSFYS
jgi:hypothetical protein